MRILIVEDDEIIAEGLEYSLMSEGYEVSVAGTVKAALEFVQEKPSFDFCLLDVILPDGNGFDIYQKIRETSQVPILFLTSCDDEVSTVRALDLGADDYIANPFRVRELLARMKAILRRYGIGETNLQPKIVAVGKNQVNLSTGKVYCGNEEVILTAMEYKLLLIFLNNRGQILTRDQILNNIWKGAGEFVNENTLSVYVGRLRKKLGDTASEEAVIETIRGVGYLQSRRA